MTQGTIIELVLLRVNGGQLNDEGAVQKSDIRAYLPAAISYVTSKAYYTNRREEGDRDFPGTFYTTFYTLAIDRTTHLPSVLLPKPVMMLPSNQGIRFVMDDCNNTYTPLADMEMTMINYYMKLMPEERFYRPNGLTILLYNVSPLATHTNVTMMVDATAFTDDTVLPIQSGMETDVLDLCVAHFTAQRQQPADVVVSKNDLNAQ